MSIHAHAIAHGAGVWRARLLAAVLTGVVGFVTQQIANGSLESRLSLAAVAVVQLAAAGVYALTGRVFAAWLVQVVVIRSDPRANFDTSVPPAIARA